ncbi:MAG: pyruvate ferredoxin oxidoreductase [Gemmatimonadota bacterium]|nr:MAG: pyruvate ferredoxin oxidoreductase [Gemmatimonadota bacterium]
MAIRLKELSKQRELLSGGHRACAGCGCSVVIRQMLLAAGPDTVVGCATGCMEVATSIYPYTAWRVPWIHNAFENSAATVSGVEAAYEALKRKGKIDKEINFIAMGGDGGTYDIGIQALSGAMERGHRMLYLCYDNEAYMNTGIQRSSATPLGAATSTTPVGKKIPGKQLFRKDLTAIMIAHRIPYVAQSSVHNARDFMTKVQKALSVDGPSFINVLGTCHRGWRFKMEHSIEMSRLAVETCYWPLFEVENGKWKLSYKPKEKLPLAEWTERQGRFAHLSKEENKHILERAQHDVDEQWEELLRRCGQETEKQ